MTISRKTVFPLAVNDFPEGWNMTESELGTNQLWLRGFYVDDEPIDSPEAVEAIILTVSTIAFESEDFVDYNQFWVPGNQRLFPSAWSGVFTEVLSLTQDPNSTLTLTGTDSWYLEEDTVFGFTDMFPNFSATASVTGGTGQFFGAYGELKSLPCSITDAFVNPLPCVLEGRICMPK